MIALSYYLRSLRWTSSVAFVVVTTPTAFVVWSATKTLSCILPRRIKNASDELFYEHFQRMLLFLFEELTGVQIHFHGDIPEKAENSVVIFNHQCTIDWMLASSIGVRSSCVGIVRYILKESLKRMPFYGFYLKQHGCIYVNRENFLETRMKKEMEQYADKKYWMVIFPEGTRFNPQSASTLDKSQEYAIANGFTPLTNVLTPRLKGFEMCLKYLPDLRNVYDVTVMYDDTSRLSDGQLIRLKSPSLLDLLKGRCRNIHVHMEKIAMETIPTEGQEVKQWLFERFQIKDRLMKDFYSNSESAKNIWDSSDWLIPLGLKATLPSFLFFLGVNTLLLSTSTGRKVYLASVLCGSLLTATTVIFKE